MPDRQHVIEKAFQDDLQGDSAAQMLALRSRIEGLASCVTMERIIATPGRPPRLLHASV